MTSDGGRAEISLIAGKRYRVRDVLYPARGSVVITVEIVNGSFVSGHVESGAIMLLGLPHGFTRLKRGDKIGITTASFSFEPLTDER